ncbi:ATP-binding protein [Streptomyces peucetius]|uniref:ATP-binding protein n=1 Tax=Streptomyces peucetius TaxID=1950 RepID=A0ABY6I0D2_STRPE|nr:ATP-binding protein [Streptomyces peucetius]UYQ60323.1 ATP-binding protein [Streptomyces peucetius]
MGQAPEQPQLWLSRRFTLDGGQGVVGRCRDLTRQVLDEWFAPSGAEGYVRVDDVLLLVSEVVTNACTHGGFPCELSIDRGPGRIRVQVSDTSPAGPVRRGPHQPDRVSGHGLHLLERLSDEWGWMPRGAGKAVWFAVAVPRDTLPSDAMRRSGRRDGAAGVS